MRGSTTGVSVAVACGGTGGHLFPGLAVARELKGRGARVSLFVSPKEVDQQAVLAARAQFEIHTLPLVAFSARRWFSFLAGTWKGYRAARLHFRQDRPDAVLAMGGFTAAAPVLAGRRQGARVFLHESNAIPGRANRWLASQADVCFAGFTEATDRWKARRVEVTGTPVRSEIRAAVRTESCQALSLDPGRPVLLVTGGSQGAHGVNQLTLAAAPELARRYPELQIVHLTGRADFTEVEETYRRAGIPALVRPFLQRMEQALAAATVVVSRSGASSLAELAARRLPSVLVPYPTAADDHQRANARAFVSAGAALVIEQTTSDGAALAAALDGMLADPEARGRMAAALERLDVPDSAARIADRIWAELPSRDAGAPRSRQTARAGQPEPVRAS